MTRVDAELLRQLQAVRATLHDYCEAIQAASVALATLRAQVECGDVPLVAQWLDELNITPGQSVIPLWLLNNTDGE